MKVQDVIQELHQLRDENYLFDLTSSRSTTSLYSFIGVPYHVVKKVAKRIRRHYNLATDFWNQPYYESKQLSFLITNASVISEKHIDKHIVELHDDFLIDKFIAYVVLPSKYANKKAKQWTKSKDPFLVRLGYQLIAEMAKTEDNIDFDYAFYLDQIAKSILPAGNDIKLAMNQALISIGMNKDELYTKALGITKQLGKLRDSETKKMLKCPDALTLLNSAKTRAKFKVEF